MTEKLNKNKKLHRGGRNWLLFGLGSVVIALITTSISLAVYHNSGDIYIDRSRPGFLPDEKEVEEEEELEDDYSFPKSGVLSADILEEYLEKLDIEVKAIDGYENPFSSSVLSDEKLGIPAATEEDSWFLVRKSLY